MGIRKEYVSIVILLACGSLFSCSKADPDRDASADTTVKEVHKVELEREYIAVSDTADFRSDFRAAQKKGDMRFVAIMGYSLEVPGVPDFDMKYSDSYEVKVIEGTSDSYPDSSDLSRWIFFRDYAKGYNELVLRAIGDEAE